MDSLTGSILIDFENMPGSEEEKDYHKQVYSTIKLHLSEMEKYEKTSHFNMCKKCGMVLTTEVSQPLCRTGRPFTTGNKSALSLGSSRR